MKYILQQRVDNAYNAGFKAVRDTTSILRKLGYHQITFLRQRQSHAQFWEFVQICSILRILLVLKKNDVVFVQWPFYGKFRSDVLIKVLKKKKVRIQVLIHDLNQLRYNECDKNESELFNVSDLIIAHSASMKNYLISNGIKPDKIRVLTTFDYLTDDYVSIRSYSKDIVFAGNLSKSTFLRKMDSELFLDMHLMCYGLPIEYQFKNICYMGKFSPENVSIIKGSWGLVWDGDSIDCCDGEMGKYLRYNSPHKLSLFIVALLPVIVWREQALSSYVKEKGIGIIIDSLCDLPDAIRNVTDNEYNVMQENIKKEADLLRKGSHLSEILT